MKTRVKYHLVADEELDLEFPFYRSNQTESDDGLTTSLSVARISQDETITVLVTEHNGRPEHNEYSIDCKPTNLLMRFDRKDYVLGRGEFSCTEMEFDLEFNRVLGILAGSVNLEAQNG
jgi:hypothetical protein